MTVSTFSVSPYSFSAMARSLVRQTQALGQSRVFSGPSPFEVPDAVSAMLESKHKLVFKFDYADEEEAEDQMLPATEDGNAWVSLGKNSKKILQISFENDLDEFLTEGFPLDEKVIASHVSMPRRTLNSFHENVEVIKAILHSLPDGFVNDVRGALRSADYPGVQEPALW